MNSSLRPKRLPVLVVSLPECADRRSEFSRRAHAAALNFEYMDAVDASNENVLRIQRAVEQAQPRTESRRLGGREIACALSHRHIYKKAVTEHWAGCLILEDDAGFDSSLTTFIESLESASESLADKPLMIYLGGREGFEHRILVLSIWRKLTAWRGGSVRKVAASEMAIQRTCGYYVTRRACQSLLAGEANGTTTADAWDARLRDGHLSEIWVVTPPVVTHPISMDDSLIEPERRALINEYATHGRARLTFLDKSIRLLRRRLLYPVLGLIP